jgi:HD-GYP domain-containing protein (c-di-GMP phosphodiesterase class II)
MPYEKLRRAVALGGLLHDIGKLIQRAEAEEKGYFEAKSSEEHKTAHEEIGKQFFENFLSRLNILEEKNRDLSEELQLLKIVDNFFKDFIDFELERLDEAIAKSSESDKEAFRELKKFYQSFKAYTERYKNTCLIRLGKHTGRYHHTVLLSLWKRKTPLLQEVLRTFSSKTRWVTMENYPLGWMFLPVPEKG